MLEGLECWNVGADQAPPPFFCSASAEFGLAGSHRVANCPFMMPYERLEAWQACHQLFLETYRGHTIVPQGRALRIDFTNEKGGLLGSREHRRRYGQAWT